MLEIYIWFVLISGLFFTGFGFFAYLNNPRDISNKMFGLVSLAYSVWNYVWYFLLTLEHSDETALLLARILILGSTLIPVFFAHWALAILGLHKRRKLYLKVFYGFTILFLLFSFSNAYIPSTYEIFSFTHWPVAGPLYIAFLILGYGFFLIYAFYELVKGFASASGQDRYQIGYMLLGAILSFLGGGVNFPFMFKIAVSEQTMISVLLLGAISLTTSPFIFSYAAMKHNLMHTKVVVGQFFAGAIALIFLINLLRSGGITAWLFNSILFLLALVAGILFIRSIKKEVEARKEIEKLAGELQKANTKLKELDEQKSQFLSIASHQFRSPLTAIKGYASLIMEGSYGEVPSQIKAPIENMFKSAENLVFVVEDFLNISRIEQGRMKYDFERTDMKKLVADIVEEIRPVAENRGLAMTYDASGADTMFANIDTSKIRQVIINLIDNSAKYTPKGWVKVSIGKHDGKILISVSDSGVGISKENIGKLFEMFVRTENAHKVNVMGTGLGLYVAKQMIEAHGGRIWAESEGDGKGSTFFVELDEISK